MPLFAGQQGSLRGGSCSLIECGEGIGDELVTDEFRAEILYAASKIKSPGMPSF